MAPMVLFVCTGNVCRSPMAELLLREMSGGAVDASSAGMMALVGEGVDGASAQALRTRGIDPSGHRARQFESDMALDSDLILTAERAHREAVVAAVPAAFRRVFTLREFVRLLAGVSPPEPTSHSAVRAIGRIAGDSAGGLIDAVARAAAARGRLTVPPVPDADIADPFRQPVARAERTLAEIETCLGPLVAVLRGARRRPLPYPSRSQVPGIG